MVNELRVGYNKTAADFSHATVGQTTGTAFGFRGLPAHLDEVGGIPRITITGYQSIGVGNFRPQYHNPFAYQVTDALTWARGAQTWKFGFDYRYKQDDWVDLAFRTVAYNFDARFTNDGIADFLLGYTQSLGGSNFFVAQEVQQNYSAFVQNDWKIRPNLTLNLGLRYEYTTPLYGKDPYVNANIDYAARQLVIADPAPLVYGGRRADNRYAFQKSDFNNFGPRLGIAYQVTDRLVMRSGFGMFYNGENITGTTAGELLVNAPNLYRVTLQRAGNGPPPLLLSDPVPSTFLDTGAISPTNLSFNSRWPQFEAATVTQWNVATEYLVTGNSTVEVAYVGNKARNLDVTITPNNTPWGIDGSIVANRPFPEYGTLGMRAPLGHSDYHALQAKYERRFSAGWYALASYTLAAGYSEAPTFGAGGGGAQNYDWSHQPSPIPILERAFMEQLTRHRLSVSTIARVPVGRGQRFGSGMNRAPRCDRRRLAVTADCHREIRAAGQRHARAHRNRSVHRPRLHLPGEQRRRPAQAGRDRRPAHRNRPEGGSHEVSGHQCVQGAGDQYAWQRAAQPDVRTGILQRRHRIEQAVRCGVKPDDRPPHRSVQRIQHREFPQSGSGAGGEQLRPDSLVVRSAAGAARTALRLLVMARTTAPLSIDRREFLALGCAPVVAGAFAPWPAAGAGSIAAGTEVSRRTQYRPIPPTRRAAARRLLERR